jgi:hypothetical protein
MSEAEAHKGVSLVIAYAPCALQGPDGGMSKSQTVGRPAGGAVACWCCVGGGFYSCLSVSWRRPTSSLDTWTDTAS